MRAILGLIGRAILKAATVVVSLPFALIDVVLGRSQQQNEAHQQAWAFERESDKVTEAEREAANRADAARAQKWCADREMGRPGDLTGLKRSTATWLTGLDSFERQVVALASPQQLRNHLAGFLPMRAIPRTDTKDFGAFRDQHKADRAEIEATLKAEVEAILDGRGTQPEAPLVARPA